MKIETERVVRFPEAGFDSLARMAKNTASRVTNDNPWEFARTALVFGLVFLVLSWEGRTAPATGPLRVNPANPRYFTDGSGKAVLLVGDHTWYTLQDSGYSDPPPVFDYSAFLSFLQTNQVNFFRMFVWEQSKWSEGTTTPYYYSPSAYQRTGPGTARDGKPKFDLTKFNQSYFDRLRQRVIGAGNLGIYVSIQLFEGFSVADKGYPSGSHESPWPGHPFNGRNNINGIDGDTNSDNQGYEIETLAIPAVTSLQEAYVEKVIDTVNDLDNILYEIVNESDGCQNSVPWQNHMIDFIHSYEAGKAKQHPVGFTVPWPCGNNADLFASHADWISPNSDGGYFDNPPPADGSKVVLTDTDHLCYPCGDRPWVWRSFTRGYNPAFMDPYDCTADWSPAGCTQNDPTWVSLRKNLGHVHSYANRINLAAMTPHGELTSTAYCLANPSSNGEFLVYQPLSGSFTVNLSNTPGSLSVEWFDPVSGSVSPGTSISGGSARSFTPPFSGEAVLYLKSAGSVGAPDLTLLKTHSGNFTQGQSGATYTLTASNVGTAITSGTVTVRDTLPAGLTATAINGSGWSCSLVTVSCSRGDGLAAGASYPAITLTVNVASNAPSSVTNTAAVSGGGESNTVNDAASDSTTINSSGPPPPNLALAYSMDQGSGTVLSDQSGNSNNGVLMNGTAWTTGKYGNGLSFDAINDYVSIANSPSLDLSGNSLTIEFWANVQSGGSTPDYAIIEKPWVANQMNSPYYQYGVEFQSGIQQFVFLIGTPSGAHSFGMAGSYGSWHHIAFSYNGSNVRGYVDGVEKFVTAETSSLTARGTNLFLGVDAVLSQAFKGSLDDLRIYNRALSQVEIQNDMNIPIGSLDTTPPTISGVGASSITSSGATISWTTNEASDTQVQYGNTTSYGSSTSLVSTLVTSHSASLSGLQASTLYHYRVKSKDAAGNLATSADSTFTTAAVTDTTPPTISGVGASPTFSGSETISWTTNEASDSQVEYGTTAAYGSSTALATALVTNHSATLSGLQLSTLYHYRVKSRDAAGNLAASGDFTFTTAADSTPPAISGVGTSSITASAATISWTTDEASDSQVEYGTSTAYGSSTGLATGLVTNHSTSLTGLQPSSLYHYRVKSRDGAGNLATSSDFTFTTTGDTTPPTISGVGTSSITASAATISWTTDEASDSQVEYGTTTAYGSSTGLATGLVTNHSNSLTGLQPSTLYHYRVKSRDAAGNLATSGDFTFTTTGDTTPPTISAVGASRGSSNSETISWTTNEASDSQVEYGTTTAYGSSTALATALVTNHSATLSGLQLSTLYHYRVKSRDAASNLATSGDFTFTTTGDTTPPTISGVGASSITASAATISWTTDEASDSQVEYGTTTAYGSSTGLATGLVTNHSTSLTGLQPSSLYHYRVKSRDAGGNLATSSDQTFTTAAESGNAFTQISLTNVGNTSVTINWKTSATTTGVLEYGPTSVTDYSVSDLTLVKNHITKLSGLLPSTLYHYQITATHTGKDLITSAILAFKTSDQLNQPAKPSSQAIFVPSIVENTQVRTNLGINNTSTTAANVSITLVDNEGIVLGTQTLQVYPKGLKQINSVARVLFTTNSGTEIQGSLYLESDQPIRAWASQIDNTINDPSLLLSRHTGVTKLLIPSAANVSSFSSSLVLMNVGTDTAQVSLKAYNVNGSVLGQTSTPVSVEPTGLLSFVNVLQTLGVNNNYGPIEISSLNNVPLIATSRVTSTTKSGGFFEGVNYSEASVTRFIPNIVDNTQLRTNIGINNVSDQTAIVMVRLINEDGVERGASQVTVAAKGLTQMNNVARLLLNQTGLSNFEGYIRLESNQPIFGWASVIDNVTNDPGFAVSHGEGTPRVLIGSTANLGGFRSTLVVINTGDTEAVVDITSRDVLGNINGELHSLVIPAGGYFSSPNILEQLGVSNNFGPLEILSTNGQLILVTSRVSSTSGTSGFFEGESIQ
jgi:hypothetical protein